MSALVKKYPAVCLFILASVLGVAPLALVSAGVLPAGFSQLGALSASTAGLLLAVLEGGRGRMTELLRRGLVWRVGVGWWATALLYTAVVAAAALAVATLVGGATVDWTGLGPIVRIVPMLFVLIILAGLGEEFGWRGFLLPRLQIRHNALVSSLVIGTLHSLWHVPLFLVDGTAQHGWAEQLGLIPAFMGYAVFVIAWAIQLTWVFNNTRGSVLLVAVVHGAGNAWIGGYFDVTGQAGMVGNSTLAVLMVVLAVAIVAVAGPTHLSRVTERNTLSIGGGGAPGRGTA
jgi:membrane protease YdiL (CAAX protease family)